MIFYPILIPVYFKNIEKVVVIENRKKSVKKKYERFIILKWRITKDNKQNRTRIEKRRGFKHINYM